MLHSFFLRQEKELVENKYPIEVIDSQVLVMRGEKEIRKALKRLKDEQLRRMRYPDSYYPFGW